jgi:glycogen synthase
MNGMPSSVYPENIEYFKNPDKYYKEHAAKLIRPFGPDSNLVEVKRDFRVAFQRETKLNEDPNAIILLYCARADRYQKSIHWVEEKAQALVDFYKNRGVHLQIGLIANGVGKEHERKAEEDILGRIAYASKGDICYYNHTKELDALGNAATEQGFGPSRFEPCGQNDMRAFLYGALFVGTNTGGYHDKIENLRLKIDGATRDHGNGFTFDYHPDEFWKAMIKGVDTILKLRDTPSYYEANLKRIMVEARKNFGIDNMTAAHIQAYERLIGAPIF